MTELEGLLKAYRDAEALANLNLDDVPWQVRPGRESQKREAKEQLRDLRVKYGNGLVKNTFGIAVRGPGAEAWAKLAQEEAEVLVVDAQALYKRIAEKIFPAMGNGEFGVSHFSRLIQELRDVGAELNLASLGAPKWVEPVSVGNLEGLQKYLQTVVDSSVGLQVVAMYLNQLIVAAALEANAGSGTVPVVLTNTSPETESFLLDALFPEGRRLQVNTQTDVTRESVLETFNKIKKQLKTTKQKTN